MDDDQLAKIERRLDALEAWASKTGKLVNALQKRLNDGTELTGRISGLSDAVTRIQGKRPH
ncbi:hypothetical protein [Deinococcus yunweiensis]|uniref:hypothetical protein n=1 Tax=Deinococcus yunweiensis TaxID=367282 RepID=UPI00398F5B3C